MNFRLFLKKLFGLFIVCALIFLALKYNASTWQRGMVFLIFWLITAKWWRKILIAKFDFSPRALRVWLLSALGALMVAGWMIGAGVYFYRFTPTLAALALFGAGILPLFFGSRDLEKSGIADWFNDNLKILEEMPRNKAGVFLYIILWLICASQLFGVYTTALPGLVTPWQMLPSPYIYWFGAATLVLGFLCFAKLPAKVVLFLLCAHTFLLTSYLPATHEYFYNADQWRHLGQELNLVGGNNFTTVAPSTVIPTEVEISVQPSKLNFWQNLDIGRLGYAQFWSLGIIAKTFFNFDLMDFNRWFGPILWSLFFPILAFEWGRALGWKKSESLFLAWLGLLPFGLQIAGATTLPVNIGFLFWLFIILLAVKRRQGDNLSLGFLFTLGILSIFGYTLYFILFWLAFAIFNIQYSILNIKSTLSHVLLVAVLLVAVLLIPAIELATGYSNFNPNINWLAQTRQAVGNFSAYYLADGPRLHDIAAGNILFNQTPSYAFVPNFLTQWRYWLFAFAILFWLSTLAGPISLCHPRNPPAGGEDPVAVRKKLLSILFFGLLSGNIISRYFLSGENLLARRLDVTLAWLAIIMVASVIHHFVIPSEARADEESLSKQLAIFTVVLIISLATAASYSLGPDTKTVSQDEYRAMEYVWSQAQSDQTPCILADTYPLLALEAISAKKIIGGGFPMGQNFSQTERVRLFNELKTRPAEAVMADSKILTRAGRCFGVAKDKEIRYNKETLARKFGEIIILTK